MQRIHLYANADKPQAKAVAFKLAAEAEFFGLEAVDASSAEVVIVLGGDGTILRAVHELPGMPVLGFNLGGLGYLSSVEEKDFRPALKMLAKGDFRISERTALEVSRDGVSHEALNDVVVNRVMSGHAAILDLTVDGKTATRYMADGLIVATPTGSTAYSLAAGGPVMMPDSGSLVVTPMSPHALGIRPLVVHDSAHLGIVSCARPGRATEKLGVYADGEAVFTLEEGESIEIKRAERGVKFVELTGYDPYDVLQRKLGWSGTSSGYGKV